MSDSTRSIRKDDRLIHQELIRHAQVWLEQDPDPTTRAELAPIIAAASTGDASALEDLGSRFAGPVTFGTAGLRAVIGAGESRMNTAVVTRATAGVARYLLDTVGSDARVVVGCDARHGSAQFMTAALEVFSGAGIRALALPACLPTPVTAYAVRALATDAGIMITASHNPPADNGYKVYLGGRAIDPDGRGVQIVPPADAAIAERIREAPPANLVPRSAEHIDPVGADIVDDYVALLAARRSTSTSSAVRVVLTAMHGVGGETAMRVLTRAGVGDVHLVRAQFDPDPAFPTVAFPNPEEPGALDLALAAAQDVGADIVIALDPDADRVSVAIPLRATPKGGSWRQLTGDEIGALLGEQAAADISRAGGTLACSIVSSRMLARIAAAHGLRSATTLTGFKWIARTPDLRFGYEEAIGYCTDPAVVRDKDGIGAAIRVITLVEELAANGATIEDELDRLARTYGRHTTSQLGFRVDDQQVIVDAMARLRAEGIESLAGSAVVESVDLATGSAQLPPTDGLVFRTAANDRVIIRPSGTEPKLKCYLEVITELAAPRSETAEILPGSETAEISRSAAAERIERIASEVTAVLGF